MLILGMGALGALLGILIAWSASPVVSTAMPLIFGLVGGAGGFSLLKMDMSKATNQTKIRLIGSALLACCSTCLVTLVLGVSIKEHYFSKNSPKYELKPEQMTNLGEAIDKIMLRKRLEYLGASRTEIERALAWRAPAGNFKTAADNIAIAAQKLTAAYEQLGPVQQAQLDSPSNPNDVSNLYFAAKLYLIEKTVLEAGSDPSISEARFKFLTGRIYALNFGLTFSQTISDSAKKVLISHPILVSSVANFADTVLQNIQLADSTGKLSAVDALIRTFINPQIQEAQRGPSFIAENPDEIKRRHM